MQNGTRVRQMIYRSASLNNTRENVLTYQQEKNGDFVTIGTDISFTASNTIASAGSAFPVLSDQAVQGNFTNLVSVADFATDTVWVKGTGWAIGTGVATATTADTALSQTITGLVPGRTYTLTFTATRSAGTVTASLGGTAGTARSTSSTFTEAFVAGSSSLDLAFTGAGFSGTIDNVYLAAWTQGTGWAYAGTVMTATTATANIGQALTLKAGKTYAVTYTTTRSAGTVTPSVGGTAGTARSTGATFTDYIVCGSSNSLLEFVGAGFSGTVDNVSIREMYVQPGALIEVRGSLNNDRTYRVLTANASTITVEPSQVVAETAGAEVSIRSI